MAGCGANVAAVRQNTAVAKNVGDEMIRQFIRLIGLLYGTIG